MFLLQSKGRPRKGRKDRLTTPVWLSNIYDYAKSPFYQSLPPVSVHCDSFLVGLIGLIWPTCGFLIAGQTLWGGHRFASHGDKSGGESKGHNLWLQRGCRRSRGASECGGEKKYGLAGCSREKKRKTCSLLFNSCRENEYSVRFRFHICPFWRSSAFNTRGQFVDVRNPLMYRSEPGPTPVG